MKEYLYDLGFHTYEESDYCILSHTKKFTEKELTKLIAEAIVDLEEGEEEDFSKIFEDFWYSLPQWLIDHKGFKNAKMEVTWKVFGWASVFDKKDWEFERDETDEKLVEEIKKLKKSG